MVNFKYYTPTKIIFGADKESEISNEIKHLKKKNVLIVYGKSSIEKSGLLDKVCNNLKANNITYTLFKGIEPNPKLSKVEEGVSIAKKLNIDFVLAIGGGSVIDSAKAIAVGVVSSVSVEDLIGRKDISKALPVGVILTIAAAGSEMSGTSVLTNDETLLKRSFSGDAMRPHFAILNPKLTFSLPKYQLACGVADIIMHTVERYFTKAVGLDLTDDIAAVLINNVIKHGTIIIDEPHNYQSQAEIMWAASLSHNDLTSARSARGDWAVHQLGHELSAKYNLAHGASLTAVWSTWARYVYTSAPERFLKFATEVMKIDNSDLSDNEVIEAGIDKLEAFFKSLNLPTSLSDLDFNISDKDIEDMSVKATRFGTFKPGDILHLEYKDIKNIYNRANT